ncbi:MAG: NADH:ubiquinone reductase (Na(+)-transporting) subunit C [Prolixibacteraceae bacterium]|nr:NADH:ubiquinone reductase (Na(+)-transporting) subunit C [Prolixibacteraceae bacterium]
MNRNGNTYTFIYASVMVIIVATILSVAAISLKPLQQQNIEVEKKQNILASVNINPPKEEAGKTYEKIIINSYVVNSSGETMEGIDAFTVDMKKEHAKPVEQRALPVYEAVIENEGIKYIMPLYGAGLWGPLWGYISLNSDMNTVYGAFFDHQSETPGLGAEIVTDMFQDPFTGKTLFDQNGEFVSITVAKKSEKAPEQHRVDAISGGTITSKGLQEMLYNDLQQYIAFFKKKKNSRYE